MALRNKFVSSTCAPDLGDIATYFFWKKYFDLISEYVLQWCHFWCSDVTGNLKKYLMIHFFSTKKIVGVFVGIISISDWRGVPYLNDAREWEPPPWGAMSCFPDQPRTCHGFHARFYACPLVGNCILLVVLMSLEKGHVGLVRGHITKFSPPEKPEMT